MMKTGWTYRTHFSDVRSLMMCTNIMTHIDIQSYTCTYIHTCENTYIHTHILKIFYHCMCAHNMKDAVELTFFSKDYFSLVFSLLVTGTRSCFKRGIVGQTRIHTCSQIPNTSTFLRLLKSRYCSQRTFKLMFYLVLVFLACYRQLVRGCSTEFNLFFVKGDPIKHGLDTVALKCQSTVVTRPRKWLLFEPAAPRIF